MVGAGGTEPSGRKVSGGGDSGQGKGEQRVRGGVVDALNELEGHSLVFLWPLLWD